MVAADKKLVDQPMHNETGYLTENGRFVNAVINYKEEKREPAKIKVYWKIRPGVSVDMGFYDLVDAYKKFDGKREVFKFLLQPTFEEIDEGSDYVDLLHNKTIPGEIQREVYERDKGNVWNVILKKTFILIIYYLFQKADPLKQFRIFN